MSLFVKTKCRMNDGSVALTFNGGPDHVMTAKVLDVLEKHGIKATFFVIGQKAVREPELLRRMVEEGHSIGSNSWSHGWKNFFGLLIENSEEIRKTLLAIKDASGKPTSLHRPPYGFKSPFLATVQRWTGLDIIGWSLDSLDYLAILSRKRIAERIISKTRPGDMILLHDSFPDADRLTEEIITGLKAAGHRLTDIKSSNQKYHEN